MVEIIDISVNKLLFNKGQIEGVPKNPRFIRDDRFDALGNSIRDFPNGLQYRELIVYPYQGGKYVVLCGNQRLRACRQLGHKTVPCKVVPADTDTATLRRLAILDNVSYGQNDYEALANEWDANELVDYGIDLNYLNCDLLPENIADNNDPDGGKEGGKGDNKGVKTDDNNLLSDRERSIDHNDSSVVITFDNEEIKNQFISLYSNELKEKFGCVINGY